MFVVNVKEKQFAKKIDRRIGAEENHMKSQ